MDYLVIFLKRKKCLKIKYCTRSRYYKTLLYENMMIFLCYLIISIFYLQKFYHVIHTQKKIINIIVNITNHILILIFDFLAIVIISSNVSLNLAPVLSKVVLKSLRGLLPLRISSPILNDKFFNALIFWPIWPICSSFCDSSCASVLCE